MSIIVVIVLKKTRGFDSGKGEIIIIKSACGRLGVA
jgi:hypothetical protein